MNIPRIQIRPPLLPGPRRLPRNVTMSRDPNPLRHSKCGKRTAYKYADGEIWCETCGAYIDIDREASKPRGNRGVRVTEIRL